MATQYPEDNRHEYDDLLKKISELEKRKEELVVDLMRKSAQLSDAEDFIKRCRAELEIVASKGDHNLCHIWIPELLKKTLGHTGNFPDPGKMTKAEFKLGCKFYQDDIFGPDMVPSCSGEMFNRKAVFLDRDGTLVEIIHRPDSVKKITAPFNESELVFVDDVREDLDRLRLAGFLTIMVTNQPDVANGYLSEKDWQRVHRAIVGTLGLDGVYMCRHRTQDECDRKKPSPRMLFDAADNLGINLSESYMIGDTENDMKAGKAAGCGTILLDRSYNQDSINADIRVASLKEAVRVIRMAEEVVE